MHADQCVAWMVIMSVALASGLPAPKRFRYCGKHLYEALQLACSSSGPSGGYNAPHWDRDPMSNAMMRAPRRDLGVATECCHMGCTWRTLVSYCQGNTKPSEVGEMELSKLGFGEIIEDADHPALRPAAAEVASPHQINVESIKRNEPVFGTVAPEYMRLPHTLDNVPSPILGFQHHLYN